MARQTAYDHREKFPRFRKRWDDALESACDVLESEARRRAVEGTEKAVWYKGEKVGTVREYSDTLLIFLLKANRPEKFRDNFDLSKLTEQLAIANAQNREPAPKPPEDLPGAEGDPG